MRANRPAAMATPSVSFRISRSAEDLASTLHLLSQRLVQLEQRLSLLEAIERRTPEQDPALSGSLDNAERLLLDCRSLLEGALQQQPGVQQEMADEDTWPAAVVALDDSQGELADEADEDSDLQSHFAA
jgi:hypothetical protein